jgi:hypothetical protein
MRVSAWSAYIVWAALGLSAFALAYETQLQDGTKIQVDPRTNRVTSGSGGQQLWDGVHRLKDGSTITIHSGVVVPTVPMIEDKRRPPDEEAAGPRAGVETLCLQLVRQVCGPSDQCAASESCIAAHQLLAMEDEERASKGWVDVRTYTSNKCEEVLGDRQFFAPCPAAAAER